METLKIFNEEGVSEQEQKGFDLRQAVRAVVFDKGGNIALIYSGKFNYYEIPGGGIEESENPEDALIRECQEEIGCTVKVIKELGKTIRSAAAKKTIK